MKFNGTDWVNVGSEGFSQGGAHHTSFAFSPSGEPHVAYRDGANSNKATVMKFVEETAGISENIFANSISLSPNPTNSILYVNIPASFNGADNTTLTIVDMLGQTILTTTAKTGNNTIDVGHLTSGVYFITTETRASVKFVKE
jgi:hypothetical protein